MSSTPKSSNNQFDGRPGVIYVSLYKSEPISKLSEQIQGCLQMEQIQQQPTVEIYGDIENPKISIYDIPLSSPSHDLTIVSVTPHNGKWSGFRLLATRRSK